MGPDGLCLNCRHRRWRLVVDLALDSVLKSVEIGLIGYLPLRWTELEAQGMFRLEYTHVLLFVSGLVAFTALTFKLVKKADQFRLGALPGQASEQVVPGPWLDHSSSGQDYSTSITPDNPDQEV
jgi:hypothetical protein